MISKARRIAYLSLIFCFISFSFCLAQEEYLPYSGIVHVHSSLIEGQRAYSLEKLVGQARDKGIKIIIFSDTFLRRLEYGFPGPLKIFKVSVERDSVVKYGIKKYLEDYKKIKEEFPNMIILEGVEVAPFYWWSGSILKKNFSLNDWNKHLLVIGFKNYADYEYLPVVCNRYLFPKLKDLPFLSIPVLLILLGIFLLKNKKRKNALGIIVIIMGVISFLNIFPFFSARNNFIRGQGNTAFYQDLIDYANKRSGLVFWSHPETTGSEFSLGLAKIHLYTPSYPESLILTSGYTGFGVNMLPGTNHNLILAGQEWDKVLLSYCRGRRSQPVWVVGEADYRGNGPIDSVQDVFLLPSLKTDSVYDALRRGKLYAKYYAKDAVNISLDDFRIQDSENQEKTAHMGDEVEIEAKPRLFLRGSFKIRPLENLNIEVICNGMIIKTFSFNNSQKFDLEFQDDLSGTKGKKFYYRINIFADGKLILITNPIFAKLKT